MNNFGLLRSPRSILFGEGQRSALGLVARTVGSRALICTDARLASDPVLGQLVVDLALNGVAAKVY
ncbi:MAG: alcohol dehydrogenase, partial [Aestuariivirga sp.]